MNAAFLFIEAYTSNLHLNQCYDTELNRIESDKVFNNKTTYAMIFEITRKLFQEVTFYKTNILALYYRTGIKRH